MYSCRRDDGDDLVDDLEVLSLQTPANELSDDEGSANRRVKGKRKDHVSSNNDYFNFFCPAYIDCYTRTDDDFVEK